MTKPALNPMNLGEQSPQLVVGRGNPNARLMLIGEAPGAEEDARGVPFVGRSGQLLSELMVEAGLDEQNELYICNVIKCRPVSYTHLRAHETV